MTETLKNIFYSYGFGISCGLLALTLIVAGWRSKKRVLKICLFNVAALFIALFLVETYEYIGKLQGKDKKSKYYVQYTGSFFDNENVSGKKKDVGFGPKDDTSFVATAMRRNRDTLIYQVRYTLTNGYRFTPGAVTTQTKSLLVLGCSFVFGDGLNDAQTLPCYLNQATQGRYNVRNYGFSGYGPHQCLKICEESILKNNQLPLNDSSLVLYEFIPEHLLRAAGKVDWDLYGPCYEVENGELVFKGSFNEQRFFKNNYVTKRLRGVWHSTYVYKHFFAPQVEANDAERVLAIVTRMQQLLAARRVPLLVLIGHSNTSYPYLDVFFKGLQGRGIQHVFADSLLLAINKTPALYCIPGDGHPNALYNQELARALAEYLKKH